MKDKLITAGIALVFIDFLALSAWAVVEGGWSGVETYFAAGPWAWQVGVDLTLAVSIALGFIWRDAKSRGISPLPFVLLAIVSGSISLVLYLLVRALRRPAPTIARSAVATA